MAGLLVAATAAGAEYSLVDDRDARLRNDLVSTGGPGTGGGVALGDFDGDGRQDLAVGMSVTDGFEVMLIPGGELTGERNFSDVVRRRISLGSSLLQFGDVNGDGREDLLVGRGYNAHVYFGEPLDGTATWGEANADLILEGQNTLRLSAGDVNGDGFADIVCGDPAAAKVEVVWGRAVFPARRVNLATSADVRFHGAALTTLGESVLTADLDGDGRADLALSAPGASTRGRTRNGTLLLYRHRALWDADWDIAATTPTWTVDGSHSFGILQFHGAADLDGDGAAELLLSENGTPPARTTSLLRSGEWVGHARGDLASGGADARTPVIVQTNSLGYLAAAFGDWDGDGENDLFLTDISNARLLWMASRAAPFPSPGATVDLAPFVRYVDHAHEFFPFALGDVNGDGMDDAVFHIMLATTAFPTNYVHVFHGFRPLTRPSLTVGRSDAASRWVRLGLSVDGDPVETRLNGDVEGAGAWRPFRAEDLAWLTPSPGAKSLSAIFRNVFGRVSEPATAALDLDVGGAPLGRVAVNRVRPGQPLAVDCWLESGGRLEARIVDELGARVRTLWDGDVAPGLTALTWDGRDGAGREASSGVYVLILESAGRRERHAVLVQP